MSDLIDRKALRAKLEPWLKVKDYSDGELNILRAVLYEIVVMPSADADWIPCSKGMPKIAVASNKKIVVRCTVCMAQTKVFSEEYMAVGAWNLRKYPSACVREEPGWGPSMGE